MLWPYALWYWRYNEFSSSRDLARVKLSVGPFKVSHQPAKFGGHRYGGRDTFVAWSRKNMWSNRHAILWSSTRQQHVFNFPRCTCLQNLVVIGLMEMDISILISILIWLSREKQNSLAPVCHFERFLKSRTLIYNSEVLDPTSRKTKRRRRTQTITMRYVFCENAKKKMLWI